MGFLKPDLFTRRCGAFCSADFVMDGRGHPSLHSRLVRDHAHYFFKVCVTHQHSAAEMFLALLGLGGQDVAEVRFVPLYLSRPGLLEALGSAFVCF